MQFVGHRGAMSRAPENTLRSFRRAAADGADVNELDLRMSRDGVIVVMHDATVDRTTDGQGAVAGLTLAQLKELDAGQGERIPTFDEVVAEVGTALQAEIKSADVVGPLAALLAARPELSPRVLPTSFDDGIVQQVAARSPDCRCGWISSDPTEEKLRHAVAIGARRVLFGWPGTGPAIVARAHELGLQYNVRLAETADDIERALAWGVDGVTTNDPAVRESHPATARRPAPS